MNKLFTSFSIVAVAFVMVLGFGAYNNAKAGCLGGCFSLPSLCGTCFSMPSFPCLSCSNTGANPRDMDIANEPAFTPGSRVDRDLGVYQRFDTNQFGDDRALNSVAGPNRDADRRAYSFQAETYGLGGDYWYYMNGS